MRFNNLQVTVIHNPNPCITWTGLFGSQHPICVSDLDSDHEHKDIRAVQNE